MAKHRRLPHAEPQPAAEDSGATYWSVAEGDWPEATLPAEVVDLLAPPIVVGVARVVATSRMTPPAGAGGPARTPGPTRSATAGGRPMPGGATTVRLATGAASRPPTPAPGHHPAAGRHRTV
ncbi:hypothetical protein Q2K19_17585 [Micromonospora soli]|uniref:hypothetical protein n=1 Tax=Micromonospora sp. NBRC 110009 TaxID=3061627 RepID=UPI00267201BB|nr:hypothetical protein [Micromonospora sp. NBRC 110009]WKT96053.1 hypothetical protein Q2K19_17585 [Micromonospora sp. NBRC 110009]